MRTEALYGLLCLAIAFAYVDGGRLGVQGTHFVKDGHRVFLSGTNQAWVNYAHDFGNHQYQHAKQKFEQTLQEIQAAGGNSIRVWVHIEGESTPVFDGGGHVTGTDQAHNLINEMKEYLTAAQHHQILVFFTLWNAAVNQKTHARLDGLIRDTRKLETYIKNALIPMVNGLKDHPGLGGWDIINEPEGELKPGEINSDPCYDTRPLTNSGAGWAGHLYTVQEMQRFINWQADGIKRADPHAMVTVGSWNTKANTDKFGFHNYWKDACLIKAGGGTKHLGTLTFYQVHTYSDSANHFDGVSPMQKNAAEFGLDKPVVIGEFNQDHGGGMNIQQLFEHAYNGGYSGAWTWSVTDSNWQTQRAGMTAIKGKNDQSKGGLVHFSV
ncbi:hypothetical protein CHS0354_038657 [Potamilus streckersoni]|uniref:Mannan endo-1,4-beta-mannosidase n=1 Tax=Potamilus streckersoni TaxID=2493646 RepID=A0AAE0W9B7_9BIVA|nr:hypothetical protein CHS0354_038657 [Potamilus streckersoni]